MSSLSLPQLLLWLSLLYLLHMEVVHDVSIKIKISTDPPPEKAGCVFRTGIEKNKWGDGKPG